MPPELIQKIVRSNYWQFRDCYIHGLMSDPKLGGTVTVRFVIDADGRVTQSEATPESTLSHTEVAQCIAHAFRSFVFPQLERGPVIAVYPIRLSPD